MGRLEYGRLSEAWQGEAADFTPLLAEQLDDLGAAIGVDLAAAGQTEVASTGGRRIDILAEDADGAGFVIENQYGRADHDHLTRGLAYAVARADVRGLVVVAEEHRDEFRAVARYLNDLAELDSERGISVWLVEAKAVRIDGGRWAPLFTAVVEPNTFTAAVEQAKQAAGKLTAAEFWAMVPDAETRQAVESVLTAWTGDGRGRSYRFNVGGAALFAPGPAKSGKRSVVLITPDGQVHVPFVSYAGANSGIGISALTNREFRARADGLFGFNGTEKMAHTASGWLTSERVEPLLAFCREVADAYAANPSDNVELSLTEADSAEGPVVAD